MIDTKDYDQFVAPLSATTAELIERYGSFDDEGFIESYHIINEELIGILQQAAEWLVEGFLSNERLSSVWGLENPCVICPDKEGCQITCRRKHSFDKEVYGGLLCSRNAAAEILNRESREVENMVHFKVRFTPQGTLIFTRDKGHSDGAIKMDKNFHFTIDGKEPELRPWSASLYAMFVRHPEGFPLTYLAEEGRSEFIKIYKTITKSDIKVAKLRSQLKEEKGLSRLLNNKLSELNKQLRECGIAPIFLPRTEQHKANNKPFFIPYLKGEK